MIVSECYERTVRLDVPGDFGSGFTISRNRSQWLITADHLTHEVDESDILVSYHGDRVDVGLTRVPNLYPTVDVATYRLDRSITPELDLNPTSDGVVFSQDVYFLGYPHGLGLQMDGVVRLPFVKKAIVSASDSTSSGQERWYLDGINNPGFSGGPVVFCRNGTTHWQVMTIVSGYLSEKNKVVDGGSGAVLANTGIIVANDIRYAVESIDAFTANES